MTLVLLVGQVKHRLTLRANSTYGAFPNTVRSSARPFATCGSNKPQTITAGRALAIARHSSRGNAR
jgi:hypothetical protein